MDVQTEPTPSGEPGGPAGDMLSFRLPLRQQSDDSASKQASKNPLHPNPSDLGS